MRVPLPREKSAALLAKRVKSGAVQPAKPPARTSFLLFFGARASLERALEIADARAAGGFQLLKLIPLSQQARRQRKDLLEAADPRRLGRENLILHLTPVTISSLSELFLFQEKERKNKKKKKLKL